MQDTIHENINKEIHHLQLQPLVKKSLEEDWGHGDWTTDICISEQTTAIAKIVANEDMMLACAEVISAIFTEIDKDLEVNIFFTNGNNISAKEVIAKIKGKARSILKGERVALNFLARLCGIATTTAEFVQKIKEVSEKTQLLDARQTTPSMRLLEKTATAIGGARNHRLGLCDGVIVKENHIRAAGGIKRALSLLQESLPPTLKVEVEATQLEQVQEALEAGADLITLDNMSVAEMALAARTVQGKVLLEASGNITLENVQKIAATGVDYISSEAIVHAARWSDLSLTFAD